MLQNPCTKTMCHESDCRVFATFVGMEHLDGGEADYHRRMGEVLTQGFTAEYHWCSPRTRNSQKATASWSTTC